LTGSLKGRIFSGKAIRREFAVTIPPLLVKKGQKGKKFMGMLFVQSFSVAEESA
jgi:hypothetical protein